MLNSNLSKILQIFIQEAKLVFSLFVSVVIFLSVFITIFTTVTSYGCQNNQSNICKQWNTISKGCIPNLAIQSKAEYQYIDAQQCTQFKKYSKTLEQAATKYSIGKLKLNQYILGGILSRESHIGGLIGGCDGYGDSGFGHGIAQIDGRYSKPRLGNSGAKGIKVELTTTKYGTEKFGWSS